MSKKIKIVLYVVFMALFVVYLFTANSIIELICRIGNPDYQALSPISFSSIQNVTTPIVDIGVDANSGGITEDFFVQGWAFCETLSDNSNKSINIVLKDTASDKAYICRAKAQKRADVYGAFYKTKNIYNSYNGVYAKFSTYTMPMGDYELYINVVENETDYGIAYTGKVFRKTAFDFYELDQSAAALEDNEEKTDTFESKTFVSTALKTVVSKGIGCIDVINTDSEGYVNIYGWASCSPETNETQIIYIGLTDLNNNTVYYSTRVGYRDDVAAAFDDQSYKNCGFCASIPVADLPDEAAISLLGEAGNIYYRIPFGGHDKIELSSDTSAQNDASE